MWIADFFQQFKTEEDIQSKIKDDVNLKGVNIMGPIVNIICSPPTENPRNLPFIFEIDDGTSVLRVVYFNPALVPSSLTSPPAKSLFSNLLSRLNGACNLERLIQVGHTVEVKGVPQMYSGNVEVKAFQVRQVIDPNDGVDRMLALDQWRQHCPIVKGAKPEYKELI